MITMKRTRIRDAYLLGAFAAIGAAACTPSTTPPDAAHAAISQAALPRQTGASRYNETPNQYVTVEGTRLAYRTVGAESSEPPLVLLQHLTGTMDDWDPEVIEGLARGRRLYVFDNAGVGASGGVTPDSMQKMAHVAEGFVDAMHLTKVDILGFSMGGAVAQQFLFDRPELVRKAVLSGTGPQGGPGVEDLPGVVANAFKRAAKERTHPKMYLFFTDTPAGQSAARDFVLRIDKHTVDPDPPVSEATTRAQMQAIAAWTVAPPDLAKLAAVKQQVLIVNGSNDAMVPTHGSYDLYQRIPRAQLILYPDSGHGALFQYHDAFEREVDTFLRSAQ